VKNVPETERKLLTVHVNLVNMMMVNPHNVKIVTKLAKNATKLVVLNVVETEN
jgi:hypothetical protein